MEITEFKEDVGLQRTEQTEKEIEQMENASDFDESFLNADQAAINAECTDGEFISDTNSDGMENG